MLPPGINQILYFPNAIDSHQLPRIYAAMAELPVVVEFIGVHTAASGPSIFMVSNTMRSSAAPLGNLLMEAVKSFTDSFLINNLPSLVWEMVCSTALSAKALASCVPSEFFIASNNRFTAAFTESAVVCACDGTLTKNPSIAMRKYFITKIVRL